ncbi:sensor histidine kinase [Pontibacter sp. MBLB2868]|uniref:sensor histidine kinase n=1 Tax=Pontibacter sp. MBLB2868 TaxID=3451555 RepID=UPI003F7559BD
MKPFILDFIRRHKVHFISWIFFISYEVLIAGILYGKFSSFWNYALHYAINIALFYTHVTVVLPATLQRPRPFYWLLPLLVICEIAAFTGITYGVEVVITQHLHLQLTRPLLLDYAYCFRSAWRAVYFMGFATGFYFLDNYLKEKRRANRVEKEHLLHIIEKQQLQNELIRSQNELIRSQNAFLKAQINPHFLFNTLNFVYNNVRKTSVQASEAILALSNMMRYALQSEDEHQQANLLEEIEHVENLIYIHQIRHDHQLQIQLTYGDNLASVKFTPLVLITLVENIFKHGELSRANHTAQISINRQDHTLTITTSNLVNTSKQTGHRIGLDNIQRRLNYSYKGQYTFEARMEENGYFNIFIEVTLPTTVSL